MPKFLRSRKDIDILAQKNRTGPQKDKLWGCWGGDREIGDFLPWPIRVLSSCTAPPPPSVDLPIAITIQPMYPLPTTH